MELTGGNSSSFSPRSGFASKFANTPSLCLSEGYGAPAGLSAATGGFVPGVCIMDTFGRSPS